MGRQPTMRTLTDTIVPYTTLVRSTTCTRTGETSARGTYSCPNGGSLSGSVGTVDLAQPAEVTYSCPIGWEGQGDKCKSVLSQPATPIYSCPSGYSLSGNMCSKTETDRTSVV